MTLLSYLVVESSSFLKHTTSLRFSISLCFSQLMFWRTLYSCENTVSCLLQTVAKLKYRRSLVFQWLYPTLKDFSICCLQSNVPEESLNSWRQGQQQIASIVKDLTRFFILQISILNRWAPCSLLYSISSGTKLALDLDCEHRKATIKQWQSPILTQTTW